MADILISGGTIITMDPERRVIDDGMVAIEGDRIVDVGVRSQLNGKYSATEVIEASRKVVMPGLIDGHGHAGHGLVKTLGVTDLTLWRQACEKIYAEGSTEEFWYAEGLLTAVERLKFGTTCGLSFFGGGDMVMRTDEPVYGDRHCEAVEQVGIREFLAVGPRRAPFPRKYSRWDDNGRTDVMVTFEDQMETCETLIQRWHGKVDGRIHVCMMFPVHDPAGGSMGRVELEEHRAQARAVRELTKKYGVLFTQDGHTTNTVKFAHEELGILGPDALLSHSTALTDEEIQICKDTDTKIVHNPSSGNSITARCPAPELLDAGVTVILGSDGTAPDRSYDMFRHMAQCMHYQRSHYHDRTYMPPGKVLEMATIDAARGLGIDRELGSLEKGKKADVILVDMVKPHLFPFNMPVHRITNYANGNDVDTVLVDGKVLMRNRMVNTVDEAKVLERAQQATEDMLDRTQLRGLLEIPHGFWGHSKYPVQR